MNILVCVRACHKHVSGKLGSALVSCGGDINLLVWGRLRQIECNAAEKVVG